MKLLLPLLMLSACALPAPGQTIRHIDIVGIERTHVQVIARELLFAVGTQLDSSLLAESERNLRRLPYLGRTEILLQRDGQHVDITVRVRDLYSRALSPLIAGSKDELSYGLVGLDYNLGGRGQSLRLAIENRAISGKRGELSFSERRLWNTRQELSSRLSIGDEGHELLLAWGRPFATLDTRRAYRASFSDYSTITRLYSGQTLVERYEHSRRTARLWYALGLGKEYKIRPSLQLRYSEDRFSSSPPYQYAPDDRRRLLTSLHLTLWRPRYTQSRFIADLGPVEDLQTGSWLAIGSGYAIPLMRNDRRYTFYSLRLSPRFTVSKRGFVFSTFSASLRHQRGQFRHLFYGAQILSYTRLGAVHSLALRMAWNGLHRPEDSTQLLLGLDNGLRGYSARRFDGSRRFIINAELRPTFYRHRWYTLAGTFFLDAGAAWIPGSSAKNLRWSPGLGLRLGLPWVYNTPVWRSDLAYDTTNGIWRLSVGLGPYF